MQGGIGAGRLADVAVPGDKLVQRYPSLFSGIDVTSVLLC